MLIDSTCLLYHLFQLRNNFLLWRTISFYIIGSLNFLCQNFCYKIIVQESMHLFQPKKVKVGYKITSSSFPLKLPQPKSFHRYFFAICMQRPSQNNLNKILFNFPVPTQISISDTRTAVFHFHLQLALFNSSAPGLSQRLFVFGE